MIQQVGFKNFRRFEEFPMMNLGNINIFVGRNNAGKSTVLKALQLIKGNLNILSNFSRSTNRLDMPRPMFVFDVDELAELHIDNFERALYNKAKRKEITLSATIEGCSFAIVLDGQNIEQNSYYVAVPYNSIELKNERLHLTFDFLTRELTLEMESALTEEDQQQGAKLLAEKAELTTRIDTTKEELSAIAPKFHFIDGAALSNEEMISLVSKRQQLEQNQRVLEKQLIVLEEKLANYEADSLKPVDLKIKQLPDFVNYVRFNVIDKIFDDLIQYSHIGHGDGRTKKAKEQIANQEVIRSVQDRLNKERELFLSALQNFQLEYIHAHAASQKVVYLKEDKGDALSRALSQFCKARILPGSPEWAFIRKWMKDDNFNIGDDFVIEDIQSAGYTLHIIDDGEKLNLADKGTGSIQMMTLLFSLAVIIHKVRTNALYSPSVLIEEPEQNIHPMLQSKLAEMFLDFWEIISQKHTCQLLIETHSEYLIRSTQVIVANENYHDQEELMEHNPFKVFYFPTEPGQQPYDMEYMANGLFAKKFQKGFFDEAGRLHLDILKNSNR